MITREVIKKVQKLLAAKLNGKPRWAHREIAKLAGVSKGTVGNISTGKRRPKKPDPKPPKPETPQRDYFPSPFKSPIPARCPECGCKALLVNEFCFECCVRKHERNRKLAAAARPSTPL